MERNCPRAERWLKIPSWSIAQLVALSLAGLGSEEDLFEVWAVVTWDQ